MMEDRFECQGSTLHFKNKNKKKQKKICNFAQLYIRPNNQARQQSIAVSDAWHKQFEEMIFHAQAVPIRANVKYLPNVRIIETEAAETVS